MGGQDCDGSTLPQAPIGSLPVRSDGLPCPSPTDDDRQISSEDRRSVKLRVRPPPAGTHQCHRATSAGSGMMLTVKLAESESTDPQDTGPEPVVNPPCWASETAVTPNLTIPVGVVGAGGPAVGEALLRRQIGVFDEDPSGPLGRPSQAVDLSDGAGNRRHQRSTPHRSVSERSTRATVERQPAAERLVIGDVCGPTVRGSPRGVQGVVASPRSCGRALSRFVRGRVSPAAASRAAPRPPRVSQAPHASVSES